MTDHKITLADARSMPCFTGTGYCSRGLRQFFERNNLNWDDFIKNGISESVVLATGDAMAIKLVEHVKAKNGR